MDPRVVELEQQLLQASQDYYNGTPTLPDEVYDALRDELQERHPGSQVLKQIGAPPASEWVKVRHQIPMGSLNKVQTPGEMFEWARKYGRAADEVFLIADKLDGLSVSLRYDAGAFVQALTRGDGEIGEDITSNVRRMKGVPLTVSNKEPFHVRGEIVLLKDDFKTHFPDKANPRNAASGTSKRLDGKGSEHLSVLVYRLEGPDILFEKEQFEELERLGFRTPTWSVVNSAQGIVTRWTEYETLLREQLPYEIDGHVVRLNDMVWQLSQGEAHGRPNGAVAFKFTPPARLSVLNDIIWQVGGTGRITPVAVFDPVMLVGATVTRASLYNIAYIEQLGVDIGATILVVRANDVIPRVKEVVESTGTMAKAPKCCPSCGTDTARDGEYVVCLNLAGCPAQTVGRLKAWIRELHILEWGESLLQRLADAGTVCTVADLYRLKKEDIAALDRMADKSAENVLKTLWGANPVSLENFLGGLSIPLCATSIIKLVIDAGYDTLPKIQEMSREQLIAVGGLGPKRADAIFEGLRNNEEVIAGLLAAGVKIKERTVGSLTGKSVCFTGKSTRKRAALEAMATNAGGSVKGSVGKGLTYLVLADPSSTSSKAEAAREHGTACISEEDFVVMCGGV